MWKRWCERDDALETWTQRMRLNHVEPVPTVWSQGSQKESLSHFLSTCPKFHHARTAAHNQVCKVLAASLQKHLTARWSLHRETPLSQGLVLELVPSAIREAGLRFRYHSTTNESWKIATWFYGHGNIVLQLKCCCLARGMQTVLCTRWKPMWGLQQPYEPIRIALQKCTASGWRVWVLPWVVGTRGLVHEQSLHGTLKFLDIPHKQWSSILQDSVRASFEALAFMCRLCFSTFLQNRTFDTDDPQSNKSNPFVTCVCV